jgi:hypothetical protein
MLAGNTSSPSKCHFSLTALDFLSRAPFVRVRVSLWHILGIYSRLRLIATKWFPVQQRNAKIPFATWFAVWFTRWFTARFTTWFTVWFTPWFTICHTWFTVWFSAWFTVWFSTWSTVTFNGRNVTRYGGAQDVGMCREWEPLGLQCTRCSGRGRNVLALATTGPFVLGLISACELLVLPATRSPLPSPPMRIGVNHSPPTRIGVVHSPPMRLGVVHSPPMMWCACPFAVFRRAPTSTCAAPARTPASSGDTPAAQPHRFANGNLNGGWGSTRSSHTLQQCPYWKWGRKASRVVLQVGL